MLNIFQTSSNNSTALRMQNRGVVSIFGAGYPGCDLAAWVPNAPKMEGESKGGDIPSWHTTFGESLVCYTFCPGWRGKGDGRQDSRFAVPGKQAEEWSDSNHSSACFQEGQKVYTAPVPRPPSRRSDIASGPIIGPASHPSGREVKPLTGRLYHLPWADFQRAKPAHAGALPASPDQFHRPPYVKWHR